MSTAMAGMPDFLNDIVVDTTADKVRKGGGPRKQRNPIDADLRIWKDGAIYPSEALVKEFNLEYQARVKQTKTLEGGIGTEESWVPNPNPGFGFDVASSDEFLAFKSPKPVIVLNVVPRSRPKVDLFGTVNFYSEKEAKEDTTVTTGAPKISVLEQGTTTYGKRELLPMLAKIYGVMPNEEGFIDLKIFGMGGTREPFEPAGANKTVVYLPKKVAAGDGKGQGTVQRRENPRLYVLYPVMETAGKVEQTVAAPKTEAAPQA